LSNPRLYLVTDRHATAGRPLVEVIRRALAPLAGGRHESLPPVAVQLREKDLPGRALHTLARELRLVTADHGAQLFVNDRVDVALAVGADGVHLGRGALLVKDVRAIAPALRIGVSTHAPDEIEAAHAAGADFAVFGPVWAPLSKRAHGDPVGLRGLAGACRGRLPVLALGGVKPENARACLDAGAAGLALVGAVATAADPDRVVRLCLDCF